MNKLSKLVNKLINKPVDSVAMVLSGGGSRGAIQVGVLQALDEYNIKVKAISGTSIGAIVGVFYSGGLPPVKIKELMKSQGFLKLFHIAWNKKGLLTMEELMKLLKKYLPDNTFESLNIPFYACASNLDTQRYEIFSSGDLHQAVVASASIPVLFQPVIINGYHFIDGGLYNNFPIEPLLKKYDYILGVHVNNMKPTNNYTAIDIAERVFTAAVKQTVEGKFAKCDYLINPCLEERYGIIDFRKTEKLFKIGYDEGVRFAKYFEKDKHKHKEKAH